MDRAVAVTISLLLWLILLTVPSLNLSNPRHIQQRLQLGRSTKSSTMPLCRDKTSPHLSTLLGKRDTQMPTLPALMGGACVRRHQVRHDPSFRFSIMVPPLSTDIWRCPRRKHHHHLQAIRSLRGCPVPFHSSLQSTWLFGLMWCWTVPTWPSLTEKTCRILFGHLMELFWLSRQVLCEVAAAASSEIFAMCGHVP